MTDDLDKLEALAKADAVQEVCDLLENLAGADEVVDALYVSFNGVMRHWRDAMNDAADLLQASARRDAEEIGRLRGALRHYTCSCEPGRCAMSIEDDDTAVDDQLCGRTAQIALTARAAHTGEG